jgi:hypothetical protein
MSWWDRSWLAQTLRAFLVYGWYLNRQQELIATSAFDGPEGLKLLGWELLLFIIATIVVGIIVQIFFTVLAVSTGQETTDMLNEDERDKQIEARAMVKGFTMTGLGFLGFVLALWQGWGFVWAVNVLLAGMVAADVTVNLYKFYRYLRGG